MNYWLSFKWKPNQERFIKNTRRLFSSKLDEVFKNGQIPKYKRTEVLNNLIVNLSQEINKSGEEFLSHDEIVGVKTLLTEKLRELFNRRVLEIDQQRPGIPTVGLQLAQVPVNERQPIVEDQNVPRPVLGLDNVSEYLKSIYICIRYNLVATINVKKQKLLIYFNILKDIEDLCPLDFIFCDLVWEEGVHATTKYHSYM